MIILDISDSDFKNLFHDEELYLPIRWDGYNFTLTLDRLFHYYIRKLEVLFEGDNPGCKSTKAAVWWVQRACDDLIKAVNDYLNGFPSRAYNTFQRAMRTFMKQPLNVYPTSAAEQFDASNLSRNRDDSLKLFRVTSVSDNKPYERERVFHTPFNLRSKVSTSRYSIAGYPSLYLGTSLELCCEETHVNPHQDLALAAIFQLERTLEDSNTNIRVIELGVKPQDFIEAEPLNERSGRRISPSLLADAPIRSAYLLWYPLIAACSYIRVSKSDPFAAEYIIPQLLMQWVRSEIDLRLENSYEQLIGIRYFSCASMRASDMGFNYVFPTSGRQKSTKLPYCAVLASSFCLSNPVYIHEYEDIRECERHLRKIGDLKFIGN